MQDTVRIYNTKTKQVEDFLPIDPKEIKIYCCGPTVYSYQHIGNFKTYINQDILIRTFKLAGYNINHVMNITDVGHLESDSDEGEDKILKAARKEKKKSHEIAEHYTKQFFIDWDKLNIYRPNTTCAATEHIKQMIELIKRIEANGYTYIANGNVYFNVEKFSKYGELANLNLDKLKAGSRIEIDPNKKSPFDFVLWFTNSKYQNHELLWDSPWGKGYPGWHIECSAMSMYYLGDKIDIHCGGVDHIPVHHTNEIAQSEAATKEQWVNYWFHTEFILLNSEKIAKSTGHVYLLKDIEEKGIDPLAFRLLVLSTSYRKQMNFSWDALSVAQKNLDKLRAKVLDLKKEIDNKHGLTDKVKNYLDKIKNALYEDLNTAIVLGLIQEVLGNNELSANDKLNIIFKADSVLGLNLEKHEEKELTVDREIEILLEKRQKARQDKDYDLSDKIRDQIKELGFEIEDSSKGQLIKKIIK